ncbi:MAG: hypothetical protein GY720_03330 [bacterium]|nr:hypothetical protein [bacterium]
MPLPLALFVFGAVQLVPGWVALALVPTVRERLSLSSRVAGAVALSIAQLIFVGLILISMGIGTPTVIITVNIVITAVAAVMARRQLLTDWRDARSASAAYRLDWKSVVVVAILAAVVGIATYKAVQNVPEIPSGWGYAADTAEILEIGGLPATNLQYGEEVAFAATKTAGFAWLGALRAFTGIGFTRSLQILPLALMFGAIVAAWAMFRSFTGRLAAAAAVLLLFFEFPAHSWLVVKYSRLTVEGAGLTLGLLAMWAVISADREDVPQLRWLAAVMIMLTGLTHGVTAVMTVVFVASYELSKIILGTMTWRQTYRNAIVLGLAPGLGMLVGLRLWSRAAGFALTGGGYELIDGVGDPTLSLRRVLNGRLISATEPPHTGESLNHLFDVYIKSMFSERSPLANIAEQAPLVILVLVVGLIAASWLVGNRQFAVTATIVLVAIFLIGLVFAYRYELHVFRTHPQRREFPYAGLVVIGLVVAVASGWRWRVTRAREGLTVVLVAAFAAGSIGLGWMTAPRQWAEGGMKLNEVAALDWVRQQTPEDSWILANVRTTATFGAYAERPSLTEGDTPYTYPLRLQTTLELLDSAQGWFKEPDLTFLVEHDIDYVVATLGRGLALGGDVYARLDSLQPLDSQPFLVREEKFKNVVIYSVEP